MTRIWALILWIWMAGLGPAAADPQGFVKDLSEDLAAAADAGLEATRVVLARDFDIAAMAFAALPDGYRAQAGRDYLDAYRTALARTFVTRRLESGTGTLTVLGTRQSGDVTLVGAEVASDGTRRVVEFYLRREGNGYKVVNAAVEGILVTSEQRREFRPHLLSGEMPELLDYLDKVGSR